jgi:hypothetical protein
MIEPVASVRGINLPELGAPPGYSQVVEVRAGRLVFIAGQTALDKEGKLVDSSDFAAQAKQVFHNLSIALQSVGWHGEQSGQTRRFRTEHGKSFGLSTIGVGEARRRGDGSSARDRRLEDYPQVSTEVAKAPMQAGEAGIG